VVIDRSSQPLTRALQTGLAPGTYCDVVSGDLAAGGASCTGLAVTVGSDGTARFDVPPLQAVAIHAGARIGA
jgi:alpha-amylase